MNPGVSEVRIAELAVASDPALTLEAKGLGSCVVIVLHGVAPRGVRVYGLAHVLLPTARGGGAQAGKFADTAVPALVAGLLDHGARRSTLTAALVGGARMFQFSQGRDIGERNVRAAEQALAAARIPIVAHDVGGSEGRSVRVELHSGSTHVRRVRGTERELMVAGSGKVA